jgi:predicted phage terminase large subunit-like protein
MTKELNKLASLIDNKELAEALKSGELDISSLPEQDKQNLWEFLSNTLVLKASKDFRTYVELMAPEVLPEGFIGGKHIDIICADLQAIEASIHVAKAIHREQGDRKIKAKRSQYFLPPRSMKSKLISVLFVSWFMGRNPTMDVLQLGHSTKFCIDNFGRGVLELILSDKFKIIFPDNKCRLRKTAKSVQSFQLVGGGKYYTTGAGSKIAGRGAALLISDDVISEQDAYSDAVRNKINEWYIPGARSRLQSYGTEIVVNTRWHLNDLSGYLQKQDKDSHNPWNIIRFPAILDSKGASLLGLKEGESYWPELWPIEHFQEMKRTMLASKFSAMYLQNPIADEGGVVKEEYWKPWPDDEDEPFVESVIVSLDTAFSDSEKADYSAYTVWGLFFSREIGRNGFSYLAANVILLGAEKGRWSFPKLCDKIEFIKETWDPEYFLIEKKASGQSLIQELRLKQYPIVEYLPDRDKLSRAHATVTSFISGRVWFPEGKGWAKDVITDVCQFPYGEHDDLADTVWQVLIWMRKQVFIPNEGELGYEDMLEEDRPKKNNKPLTYWGQLTSR